MLWQLPLSPCHTVDGFIYSTVLPWMWPPHEHAAVDAVVARIIVQETRLSTSGVLRFMFVSFAVCLLPHCGLSLPLTLLSLVPSSSHASPAGGYCSCMEKHICQWLFLSHQGFLPSGLICSCDLFILWSSGSPWWESNYGNGLRSEVQTLYQRSMGWGPSCGWNLKCAGYAWQCHLGRFFSSS